MRQTRFPFSVLLMIPLLLSAPVLHAQPWMDNLTEGEKQNFYSVQRSFNNYWKNRDTKAKGKGWKQFKRWEWFWEQRVYPSGEFPDRMQLYNEYRNVRERRSAQGKGTATANWSELGPSTSPGGYAGLGRINCVRTDPDDPDNIWIGSAAGGLWHSTDGGGTWSTNTDELPSLGVTDIRFDPLTAGTMYIASGDGDAGDDYSVGVLKSTDAGATWETTGLNWETSQASLLSRLLIDPDDPNILIAAGSGIFRTTDAGLSWTQTSSVRIHDLEFKPGQPEVVYASGAASNVYRSTDGGVNWLRLTNGFPSNGTRVAISVTPANPSYIYALVSNTSSGYLGTYRSTDGGDSWSLRSSSPNLLGWEPDGSDQGGQGWYDLAIAASPLDAEEIYTGGVNVWKSTDGGANWTISTMWYYVGGIANTHADQHDLYFHPGSAILYGGNDGGVYRTSDHGVTWPWLGNGIRVTEFYRFGNSASDSNRVIGGAQDNGTKMVNDGVWSDVLGGDGMEALIDYSDANIMYGELYYGDIYRSMNGGISWASISGGISESGGWITPYVIHPTEPATIIAGFQHVWKTTNRGASWTQISNFGGPTLSILAIAESDPNTIYAGTSTTIYKTTDGGATNWSTITRPAGSGSTTDLEIHPLDSKHIWLTSSGYTSGQKVYESLDGGVIWANISGSLPNVPANCVIYQKNSPERLYVGTDIGVYYRDLSTNDWVSYNDGLANVTVTELEMQYATNKLRAATYGRGIWESDAVVNVGAVIGLSQTSIGFGSIEAGTSSDTLGVTITNLGTVDTLTITSIATGGTGFELVSLPVLPVSLPPGETTVLEVAFLPAAQGEYADSIQVISNATNGSEIIIPLSGKGVEIGEAVSGVLYGARDSLYAVNPVSGALTALGATGVGEIQSLAVNPVTKELYGVSSTTEIAEVYRVSSTYGDALPVQTFQRPYMRAIAFDVSGRMFGAVSFGVDAGKLYELDLSAGEATEIGTSSVNYSSIAVNPVSGALWASERPPVGTKDRIYTVNTETGEAALVGETGFPLRVTAAIAFDEGGQLYGVTGSGGFENELILIDTATAAGTLIGPMGITDLSALTVRVDSVLVSVRAEVPPGIPAAFMLEQNYPNPFNPSTEIRYGLPAQSHVIMTIHNMLGQEVKRILDEDQNPGYHIVSWKGTNNAGAPVASGLYFYRLDAVTDQGKSFTQSRKMLLLK